MGLTLFARLTGVTAAQVEHWEQGRRTPNPMARRSFDRIAADPRASGCQPGNIATPMT
jgi:DNA-binding transcriptional regulator YiaG